ncbi:MAG: Ig-like domain-containing protein [Bacteroidales bacterium]
MSPRARSRAAIRGARHVAALVFGVFACAALLGAQSLPQAATLATVVTYPDFYSDRTLVIRGHLRPTAGSLSFEDDDGHRVLAVWRGQGRLDGTIEATGQVWDLGRMKQDDGRLSGFDVTPIVKASGQEWPKPGEVFVFAISTSRAVESSPVTTIRSLVLEGQRAVGRLVTVSGQFRGRNLFGDLPQAPGSGRSDFVLRASEAAIWVTGMPPKGKDFDLDPGQRVDTNRWLRVSGIVSEARGLLYIAAKSVEAATRDATESNAPAKANVPPPTPRPPEVLFSVPVPGETDVSPSTTVRIQLSRDLDPESLKGRVSVAYLGTGAPSAAPPPPAPRIRIELDERERVMTLRFAQPLEPWQRVQVDLLDGIKGTDGAVMKPWTLTFTVGGRRPSPDVRPSERPEVNE